MSEDEIKECLDSLYYQDDVCSISYDKLKNYIIKLKTQLQQKENIIKEAIKYIESYMPNYDFDKTNLIKLLEILQGSDKE